MFKTENGIELLNRSREDWYAEAMTGNADCLLIILDTTTMMFSSRALVGDDVSDYVKLSEFMSDLDNMEKLKVSISEIIFEYYFMKDSFEEQKKYFIDRNNKSTKPSMQFLDG